VSRNKSPRLVTIVLVLYCDSSEFRDVFSKTIVTVITFSIVSGIVAGFYEWWISVLYKPDQNFHILCLFLSEIDEILAHIPL
jgi:hypothetical protein